MKKTLIAFSVTISLSIALLLGVGLSACEWFDTSVLGKPSQEEIAKREQRERERNDSLRVASAAEAVVLLQKDDERMEANANNKAYHLVVGCYEEQANVDNMLRTLKSNGYQPYQFKMGGLTCVSAISYNTLLEAERALEKLLDKDFCPEDAWVYHNQ